MDDLRKVVCPPCPLDSGLTEIYVRPQTYGEYDAVQALIDHDKKGEAVAMAVALRARSADGKVLFGRGILGEWRDRRGMLEWWFEVAAAIVQSDLERQQEAKQGN